MVFCPEHAKRDQNLKLTPLSETTSIAAPFIWEFQIWVVTRHQYGISALFPPASFGRETSGDVTKC